MQPAPARVVSSARGVYRLDAVDLLARVSGRLRHSAKLPADLPVTGDYVEYRVGGTDAVIDAVLPRRTKISRRNAGTRETEQVLAANVDTVLIVTGLDGDYNLRRIERYLVLANEGGARPVVLLNKSDLCDSVAERLGDVGAIAPEVHAVSALTGGGLDAVRIAPGQTVVFLGSSGAGKSSIVNALLGEARQRTHEVREDDSRGRHTTTDRELIALPNGAFVIDTPGLREVQLWASDESVADTFADIRELAAQCRFGDCGHGAEPGCAVRAALDSGAIDAKRWRSFLKLSLEASRHDALLDEHGRLVEKRKLKKIHKSMREFKER